MEAKSLKSEDMCLSDIHHLISKVAEMDEAEHIQIFNIIRRDTDKFTRNQNGVFINMANLSHNTLINISDIVSFSDKKQKTGENIKIPEKLDLANENEQKELESLQTEEDLSTPILTEMERVILQAGINPNRRKVLSLHRDRPRLEIGGKKKFT
jgi:hypothetical protein